MPYHIICKVRHALSDFRAPLVAASVIIVMAGVLLRMVNLGIPDAFTFDEHHFVENARNYLAGRNDWNDHPPLGKLLMAAAIFAFGDHGAAWRLVPLLFGISSVVAAFLLARSAFRSTLAGLLAATFVAADGFEIAYSKAALLDGMLTALELWTVYALLRARGWAAVVLAGALTGAATGIKFSGVVMVLPALALAATRVRGWRAWSASTLLYGASAASTYLLQYRLGLAASNESSDTASVVAHTIALYQHHAKLTDWTHPLTSHWYTWCVPTRPILLYSERYVGDTVRTMTSLGNPLLWWASLLAIGSCLVATARGVPRRLASLTACARPLSGAEFVLLCWLSTLAPWWVTTRDSYIYHYLPSYSFGLVALGGVCARCFYSWRVATLTFVLSVLIVLAFYAPVWAKVPIHQAAVERRLFLNAWR